MKYSFVEVDRKFSIEEACAVLVASPVIPQELKDIYARHVNGAQPPIGLSLWEANQMVSALTSTMTSTPGSTPPQRIAAHAMSAVIAMTENSLTIQTSTPQVMTPVMGVYVRPEEVTDAIRYRTSSVFSYTYGESPISNKNTSDVYSRFTQDRSNMGIPHVPSVIRRQPTWSDDMLVVDQSMFRITESKAEMAAATNQALEIVKKFRPETVLNAGVVPMYSPPQATQDSMVQAYTMLAAHRAVRGEDKSGASHLTSGYYSGALPRTLETLFFNVADIMHVVHLLKLSAVEIMAKMSMSVATSLARSGLVVVSRGMSVREDPFVYDTKVDPPVVQVGVYRFPYDVEPPIPKALFIGLLPDQRPMVKDNKLKADPSLVANITRYLKSDRVIMVWSYLSPELDQLAKENSRISILPSHHAHALSVIVLINSGLTSWDIPTLVRRGVHANIYKTHFPYSRSTFIKVDQNKYNFHSLALRHCIRISHTPFINRVTKAIEDFGIVSEDDQASIQDYTAYETVLAKFYQAKNVKYTPSQPQLAPALSAVDVQSYIPHGTTTTTTQTSPDLNFTQQQSVAFNADDLNGDLLFNTQEDE